MGRARDIANLIGGATPDIILKTSDGAILNLQTSDTTVTQDSVLGAINFQAPDEADGTDAILVASKIEAIAEGTFSASSNATSLVFTTASSAAAGTASGKMTFTSGGELVIKDTDTADGSSPTITLQSGDTDIAQDDVLGTINFQAPDEGTGTDAILVAAGISAISEGDFSSSSNATKLSFKTGASEAAAEKMSLSSAGLLTVSGRIITDDTTEATSTTDGSLQTDGGLSVAKDAVIGDDLKLLSDSSVVSLGADSDVTITHNADKGITLNSMDISGVKSINGTDSVGSRYGQIGGNRNFIINGDTSICQRATSVSSIGNGDTGYHVQDRWAVQEGASPESDFTMSRATEVPDGFQYSLKLDCTTAESSLAAGEYWWLETRLEGQDLWSWCKGTSVARPVTLSFWVNATKTGTSVVSLYDNDNTRHISKSYTVSSADTWEYKTITFAGDTTGVWDRNNGASLQILWWLMAGTNFTSGTLATSWAAYDATNAAVGQVNHFDNTSNNFHITGVQLELGETATVFQNESYAENLARCQRYFYKGEDLVYGTHHYGSGDSGASYAVVWFPVTMRADPTITGINSNSTGQQVSKDKMDCYRIGNYANFDANHTADAEL